MSGYILRENDPSIVLTADQVDRLVKNGDGDAALLYLLLLRADRGITEQELQSRLRWSQLRLNAAETGLQRLGLIQRPAETPPPAPAEERPVYSAQDLAALLEDDRSFRMLIPQVEEKLGRKLKTAALQVLAGLYDDLGMPADVIYLLVNHCITRSEERYGPGRRPTLRQIEKEGYYWARQGLFDQDSAARYLKTWRDRQQGQSAYMQVLGLGQRRVVGLLVVEHPRKDVVGRTVQDAFDFEQQVVVVVLLEVADHGDRAARRGVVQQCHIVFLLQVDQLRQVAGQHGLVARNDGDAFLEGRLDDFVGGRRIVDHLHDQVDLRIGEDHLRIGREIGRVDAAGFVRPHADLDDFRMGVAGFAEYLEDALSDYAEAEKADFDLIHELDG